MIVLLYAIIILISILYYFYYFLFYLFAKTHKVLKVQKENIKHVSLPYYITSLVSLFILYKLFIYINLPTIYNDIFLSLFIIYSVIMSTYLIPYKTYYITKKGIVMLDFHLKLSNLLSNPYKHWSKINIKYVNAEKDLFYLYINEKKYGLITLQLHYQDFYSIEYFKNKKTSY